jgi:hypothetical protein
MSKEEVLKAIAELKQQYEPVTIDITPNEKANAGNRQKVRERLLEAVAEDDVEVEDGEILDDDAH